MAESVYKVIELIGTSTDSWEMAAKAAIDRAAKSLRDLRVERVRDYSCLRRLRGSLLTARRAGKYAAATTTITTAARTAT